MRYFWISLLMVPMMLPATSAIAQWGPGGYWGDGRYWDDEEEAFPDQLERSEQTKAQMESLKPHIALHPGPEGSPGEAQQLLRDRLQVLQENKATAVQQKKSPEEIAQIDAQIKSLQEQLTAY